MTGDKSLPDLPADVGPSGYVLQVGIDAADPACGRARLQERRVDFAIGTHISHERIGIGSLDFGELSEFKDERNRRVLVLYGLQ